MQVHHALFTFALAAGALVAGSSLADAPAQSGGSPAPIPYVTRVFYLQGIEPREAATLLRSQAQIRQLVTVEARGALVASDIAERVDRSEGLLREHDAIVRAIDPHEPLAVDPRAEIHAELRTFHVDRNAMSTVVTILKAIYQFPRVSESEACHSVTVGAPLLILDSSEALLHELGLLADTD